MSTLKTLMHNIDAAHKDFLRKASAAYEARVSGSSDFPSLDAQATEALDNERYAEQELEAEQEYILYTEGKRK